MRRALAILLIVGLAPATCLREAPLAWNNIDTAVSFAPLALPSRRDVSHQLGAFRLENAWAMHSKYGGFGGYSALVPRPGGRLLAIGDYAFCLEFSPPSPSARAPIQCNLMPRRDLFKYERDTEAATSDPATGEVWIAHETTNAITRYTPWLRRTGAVHPAPMRSWDDNSGPEAMVRLPDGRFIVIAEGFDGVFESRRHEAVVFSGDPVEGAKATRFIFAGEPQFSPTDAAVLPDGRVLILMRRFVWPFPLRFVGRIVIADPATIRGGEEWRGTVVARLSAPLPVDNFEGIAIEPGADGTVIVWLISDANGAVTQRTLLLKLTVDPALLPRGR